MSDTVKKDAEEIYREIAAAESKVHQTDMEQIHFHEVGSVDALIDVVGSCLALELLGVDEVQALRSVSETALFAVRMASFLFRHRPQPRLLRGCRYTAAVLTEELLTPTGAAILKYFL